MKSLVEFVLLMNDGEKWPTHHRIHFWQCAGPTKDKIKAPANAQVREHATVCLMCICKWRKSWVVIIFS